MPDGSVKDEIDLRTGTITRNVGELIDEGSEEWKKEIINGNAINFYIDKEIENSIPECANLYCNLSIAGMSLSTYKCKITTSKKFNICPDSVLGITELDNWINLLHNTPIKVYYPLATPIIEHVDPAILHQHPGYTQLIQQGGFTDTDIEATVYKEE